MVIVVIKVMVIKVIFIFGMRLYGHYSNIILYIIYYSEPEMEREILFDLNDQMTK